MILDQPQLKEIFKNRPTKKLWDEARKARQKLQLHVLGLGMDRAVEKVDQYEGQRQSVVRQKYARSNKDLVARVLRPVDNIWEARGGGSAYNTGAQQEARIRNLLLNVSAGYPVRQWLRLFGFPRYIDDPMGLLFMEVSEAHPNKTYPTYKSSADVYEALPVGRRLEWVIFTTAEPGVFRVVDDVADYMVKVEGESVRVLNSKQYPRFINYFGAVPAMIISDIPKDGRPDFFTSPLDKEVELADEYLRDGSVRTVYKFRHGFPKAWKHPEVCSTCNGTAYVNADKCPDCKGSGQKLLSDPEDVLVVAWPNERTPEVKEKAGYITPDLDYLEYADKSQQLLEDTMTATHWGTALRQKADGEAETATGRFIDVQPVNNRLGLYAANAEALEGFITDHVARMNVGLAYRGSTISYGRRFILETPDALWTKYETARKNGAPQSTLDDLLLDYYESKFQQNQVELQRMIKLMKVEPLLHLTMKEAKDTAPAGELNRKLYYSDFISLKETPEVLGTPVETLRRELDAYVKERLKVAEEISPAPAPLAPGPGGLPDPGADPKGAPAEPKGTPAPAAVDA